MRLDPKHGSAYFNMAGILHMCEYPTLAMHYIEQVSTQTTALIVS